MTLQEFLKNFCCNFTVVNHNDLQLEIRTTVVRRSDKMVRDGVRTLIDVQQTSDWIFDSQFSLTPMNWDEIIEQTRRAQLDLVAQHAPIEDFFPMDTSIDISGLYC